MDFNDEEIIDDLIVENLSYNKKEITSEENKTSNENKIENFNSGKSNEKEIRKEENKIYDETEEKSDKYKDINKLKKTPTKNNNKNNTIISQKPELKIKNKEKKIINKNSNIDNIINETTDKNKNKKELINELLEKEKLLVQLINSNKELKEKIDYSKIKFKDILEKMDKQEKEKIAIENQIKEIDKEINVYKLENNNYQTKINNIKNKLELKDKIEKESNIKTLLQNEQDKNKLLKFKLTNIKNINSAQRKYISYFERQNRVKGKITELKSEIDNEKSQAKLYKDRFDKIDIFNTKITNEINSIKTAMNKLTKEKNKNNEIKKNFTQDELTDTLGAINNLKNIINEKRNDFNKLCKSNDDKIYKILSQNLMIENEINENKRMNRLLICKRNELKRIIKTILLSKKIK